MGQVRNNETILQFKNQVWKTKRGAFTKNTSTKFNKRNFDVLLMDTDRLYGNLEPQGMCL